MNSSAPVPDRFLPPEPQSRRGGAVAPWIMTLIALAVLAVVAYKAYFWFTGDMPQRPAMAAGEDPNGVAVPPPIEVQGLAQSDGTSDTAPDNAPAAVADPGDISDPDRRRAVCGYLAAESERLSHEFKQPLPPPVIDRIATEIGQLSAQTSRYGCTPGNGDARDLPRKLSAGSSTAPLADD